MKYDEKYSGRKSRFSGGFYIVIALCLLIVGGASWFALSRFDGEDTKPPIASDDMDEYTDDTPSYNESVPQIPEVITPTEDAAQGVTDQPYSSEQSTTDTPKNEIAFTMPVEGEIIKEHSDSHLQYSQTFGDMRLHTGIDIACEKGTSVSACSDGTVKAIELNTTYGNTVTIDHKNGITVKYSSLDNLKIKQGDKVSIGDIIGTAATVTAECGDKSHIHIEVFKNGKSVEPLKAMGLE